MKKLMFAAVAAFCATVVANADGITSANVVGYSTKAVEGDMFYLISAQFEDIGQNGYADLNKALKLNNIKACAYDDQESDAPEIQVRIGENYRHYYYINDAVDENDDPVEGDVWAWDGYVLTEDELVALGQGFWFKPTAASVSEGANITVNGQVTAASELGISITGTESGWFQIVANPFPISVDLNDVTTSGLTAVAYDDQEKMGNEIQVRIGENYRHYFYINDAVDENDDPVEGNVWAWDGYILTDAEKIDVGAGFWVKAFQNGSLTFKK